MVLGAASSARTVTVRLAADVSQYVTSVGRNAVKATKDLNAELAALGKDHKERFNQVALAAGGIGTALLGAAAVAVKSAMTFDKEMSAVGAVAEASGQQLDLLRTAAINAGKATVFSATEAAQAEEELAKAGLSTTDILRGGLTAAMGLAAAGGVGLAEAAETTATALNIFGLSGDKAMHAADLLAAGANKSATDVHGLALALSQGGLVAKQANLTLDDTVGVLSAFAYNGLKGSDAGTSLKTMFLQLEGPSKIAAGVMKEYGLNIYDAQGKMLGVTQIAQQLQDRFKGLSEQERNAAFAQIFGNDAVRSANILYTEGAKGIQDWINKVNDQGAAADSARKRMDNLAGDVENLRGSLETLFITSGEGANTGLRSLTQGANRILQSFLNIPGSAQTAITAIAGVTGVTLLLGAGMLKTRQKIQEVQAVLTEMGPVGAKTSTGLGMLTAGLGRLTLVLGAFQLAGATFGHDITPQVSATEAALSKFAATGDRTGEALSQLNYDLGTLGSGGLAKAGNAIAGVIEGLTNTGSVFDQSLYHAKQRLSSIDDALAEMQTSGNGAKAAEIFNQLAAAAKKQGISVDDLRKGLPNYTSLLGANATAQTQDANATQGNTTAMQGQRQVTDLMTASTNLMTVSLREAVVYVGSFKDVWDQLHGSLLNTDTALLDANHAVEGVTKTLRANHGAWKGNTDAALTNRIALEQAVQAAAKAAEAKYEETGSVKEANSTYQGYISHLKDAIIHAHLGTDATAGLLGVLNNLAAMPPINPQVNVQVDSSQLDDAIGKMQYFNQGAKNAPSKLPAGWRAPMVAPPPTKQIDPTKWNHGNRWGGVYEHADVGLLRDAQVYSSVATGARYAFAEPVTGGEAFIPKYGDMQRSRDIAGYVVGSWLGGSVSWGGGSGGGNTYNNTLNVHPAKQNLGPTDLMQWQAHLDARQRAGRRN